MILIFLKIINQASQGGTVVDYKDWQIPLGRRFRYDVKGKRVNFV